MEDSNRWIRLITVGVVLAALAVGYFLISGRLTSNTANKVRSQTEVATSSPSTESTVLGEDAKSGPTSTPSASAYDKIAERNKSGVQKLPNTGFPVYLAIAFAASAIISGLGLRKFPH